MGISESWGFVREEGVRQVYESQVLHLEKTLVLHCRIKKISQMSNMVSNRLLYYFNARNLIILCLVLTK